MASRTAGLGIVLAAATYVRPTAALLPIVFAGATAARGRRLAGLAPAVIALAIIGVLVLPWGLRNARVFGSFLPTTTSGGSNLWMGNNQETKGGYMPQPEQLAKTMNEAQLDAYLASQAKQYIREHPGQFAARTGLKLIRLHERETIGVHWNAEGLSGRFNSGVLLPLKLVSTGYWLVALALGLLGIVWSSSAACSDQCSNRQSLPGPTSRSCTQWW